MPNNSEELSQTHALAGSSNGMSKKTAKTPPFQLLSKQLQIDFVLSARR